MRILLSNDDGYFAPGIQALFQALEGLGEIVVVAPEQNRSGASNSLTLDRPLFLKQAASGFYFVNGTPTDCVHLAVTGMLDYMPDIIVSGINHGANMGDDTIYSGTVAAATEGFLLGIPSIAISLTSFEGNNYSTAGRVARELVERFVRDPIREPVLLNVNVPDIPYADLCGTGSDAAGPASQGRTGGHDALPAQRNGVLGWRRRRRRRCRTGYGFQRGRARLCLHYSPAGRSDTPGAGVGDCELDAMTASGLHGIGMTSQRTRARMIERLREMGIRNEAVLNAMAAVPRHVFVEEALASRAYEDTALPLGMGQTISQPFVVARMIELLLNGRTSLGKTLEVGAGCGYQAAVLAQLTADVFAIERLAPLLEKAKANMRQLKQFNVRLKHGDGRLGMPEAAPFDSIIVAAAGLEVPPALLEQLAVGGRLVLPVGTSEQYLSFIERTPQGFVEKRLDAVRFVPLLAGTQ